MEMSNICLAGLSSCSSSILTHSRVLCSEFLDLLDHFQPTNNHLATTLTPKQQQQKTNLAPPPPPLPSPQKNFHVYKKKNVLYTFINITKKLQTRITLTLDHTPDRPKDRPPHISTCSYLSNAKVCAHVLT